MIAQLFSPNKTYASTLHALLRGLLRGYAVVLAMQIIIYSGCKQPTEPTAIPLQITSIIPTCCEPGEQLIISGTGFSTIKDSNHVYFHYAPSPKFNVNAQVDSCTATHLYIRVPLLAASGRIYINVGSASDSSVDTCHVMQQVTITGIQPLSGPVGTVVTISGANFDTLKLPMHVLFGTVVAPIISFLPTQLIVRVPQGATNGVITLEYGCLTLHSSQTYSTVPLAITSFSPQQGFPGSRVTLFLNEQIDTNGLAVQFNGAAAPIISVSGDSMVVRVPQGAQTGTLHVTCSGVQTTSTQIFTVLPRGVVITSLQPWFGYAGSIDTIHGKHFGTDAAIVSVAYNSVPATISSFTDTMIITTVPVGVTTGFVTVGVFGDSAVSPKQFVVPRFKFASLVLGNVNIFHNASSYVAGQSSSASDTTLYSIHTNACVTTGELTSEPSNFDSLQFNYASYTYLGAGYTTTCSCSANIHLDSINGFFSNVSSTWGNSSIDAPPDGTSRSIDGSLYFANVPFTKLQDGTWQGLIQGPAVAKSLIGCSYRNHLGSDQSANYWTDNWGPVVSYTDSSYIQITIQ